MQEGRTKTLDKYTQFTQPYPNRIEPELELSYFPFFTDIELKNPTKDQLKLRGEESKRLNIIYDNNNISYEDKNIKEILSNDFKNSSRLDDIYDIDLPDCFMRSCVVKLNNYNNDIEKNESQNIKKEIEVVAVIKKSDNNINLNLENDNKNENINNYDDFDIDIEYGNNEKYEELNINENYSKEEYLNNFEEKEKENNNYLNKINDLNNNLSYTIIDIVDDEEDIKKGENYQLKENENINVISPYNNKIKEEDNKIKYNWQNKEIIDINERIKEEKRLYKEEVEEKLINNIKQIKNLNNKYNITTLNIIGEKNDEYYIGQIIEKGPNFPSNLGVIKSMSLEEFSENYFGEKLQFEEIARRDNDFEKIIKLIPVGNKKYIFSQEKASKAEIYKEENNIIILHGRAAQETYYYIMKLTGQINRSSEYTIFKVKNNRRTIRHFKDSVGLSEEGKRDNPENNIVIYEGINYGIVEDPDIDYYIIPGQNFLAKYRKLLKKEKGLQEKQREIEEKRIYNENFESIFSQLNDKFEIIMNNKRLEIEAKILEIEKKKKDLYQIKLEEKNYIETYKTVESDKKRKDEIVEELKIKIFQKKKSIININKNSKDIDKINKIKEDYFISIGYSLDMKIFNSREEIQKGLDDLENREKNIELKNSEIYCYICHINKREIIFCECSHLMVCLDCLKEISEEKGNKTKFICPACKILCKRYFTIAYN